MKYPLDVFAMGKSFAIMVLWSDIVDHLQMKLKDFEPRSPELQKYMQVEHVLPRFCPFLEKTRFVCSLPNFISK